MKKRQTKPPPYTYPAFAGFLRRGNCSDAKTKKGRRMNEEKTVRAARADDEKTNKRRRNNEETINVR